MFFGLKDVIPIKGLLPYDDDIVVKTKEAVNHSHKLIRSIKDAENTCIRGTP